MYADCEEMARLSAIHPARQHRAELLTIWRALRRFQPQWVKTRDGRKRRENPRFIREVQNLAKNDLTGFYIWVREQGWTPGKVPVLECPKVVPDTILAWRYSQEWVNGRMLNERVEEPLYRQAGSVPDEHWVVDYDVKFLTVQAVARRSRQDAPLLNYTKERVRAYRRNSRRHQARLDAFGESKTLRAWVEDPRCVVGLSTLGKRIKAGMEPELALVTPPRGFVLAPLSLAGEPQAKPREASEAS
jgi:hypothetical protein